MARDRLAQRLASRGAPPILRGLQRGSQFFAVVLTRNQRFESISLQERVSELSVPGRRIGGDQVDRARVLEVCKLSVPQWRTVFRRWHCGFLPTGPYREIDSKLGVADERDDVQTDQSARGLALGTRRKIQEMVSSESVRFQGWGDVAKAKCALFVR